MRRRATGRIVLARLLSLAPAAAASATAVSVECTQGCLPRAEALRLASKR
jgi:hypothetical protein